jgi:hypothetical protein
MDSDFRMGSEAAINFQRAGDATTLRLEVNLLTGRMW